MHLYPIKFSPILKERLWGGRKLGSVLGKAIQGDRVGESWELSGVPGDVSVVANGPYAGTSLQELAETYPEPLLGKEVYRRFGTSFPILIKFIDAREDLSIQLHPGDELAQKRHGSPGKTEMWYVMDADPGAELIIGFNRDVTRGEYQRALAQGNLLPLLHYEGVKPADAFFINSGKIHAIGGGILLAEIQQSSDVTYRVYDFDRRDAEGKTRELHTELALEAMDFKRREDFRISYPQDPNRENPMVESPYFTTSFLELTQTTECPPTGPDSFAAYICVGGKAEFQCEGHTESLGRGETLLIPAAAGPLRIDTTGCQLLQVTV